MTKPATTAITMAAAVLVSVKSRSRWIAPTVSKRNAATTIALGGIIVRWLMTPVRQHTSTAAIAR